VRALARERGNRQQSTDTRRKFVQLPGVQEKLHEAVQPANAPPAAFRREAVRVRRVRQGVFAEGQPEQARAHALERKISRVPDLQPHLPAEGQPEGAHACGARGAQAVRVPLVQQDLLVQGQPEAAHARAHQGEALQLSDLRPELLVQRVREQTRARRTHSQNRACDY